jgi:LPXTG-site transpeptidase (sortase) family protein
MRQERKPFLDPMLTGHTPRRASSYASRPTRYFSSRHFIDYSSTFRSKGQPEPLKVQPTEAITPMQQETETIDVSNEVWHKRFTTRLKNIRHQLHLSQTTVLYTMASVVFLIGLAISLGGAFTNRQVAAQVTHLQQQAFESADSTIGTSVSSAVPSSVKPSAATVASYHVSPNIPRYIDIPALNIHSEILSEGVSGGGQLQVPWDIYDTGWYNASAQPGQNGAMLIDGHSGIDGMHGVFYQLGALLVGDQIIITQGNGQKFTYKVVKNQIVNSQDVNMQSMVVSINPNVPGLNLITCTGEQIPGTDQLNERVQVYAILQ